MARARMRWSDLSPDYRRRLERQGITAASHKTADLRPARGHTPAPPERAAPREATTLGIENMATTESRAALAEWRDEGRPGWIPESRAALSDDAAAALSQLPSPDRWGDVSITAKGGNEPWQMTVEIKGGYDVTIDIPGGADARDVLALLSDPEFFEMDDYDAWEEWADEHDFEVGSG